MCFVARAEKKGQWLVREAVVASEGALFWTREGAFSKQHVLGIADSTVFQPFTILRAVHQGAVLRRFLYILCILEAHANPPG